MLSKTESIIKKRRLKRFPKGWKSHGYRSRMCPEEYSYLAHSDGRVYEHRLVWEMAHKYHSCILPWTYIHHKNDIKDDNRIENLEAMIDWKHKSLHGIVIDTSNRICKLCGSSKTYSEMKYKKTHLSFKWTVYEDGFICSKCDSKIRWIKKKLLEQQN